MFERAARDYADKTAFECFGATLTYAEFKRAADHLAAYLQSELNVKKGDRIAVMLPNILAFPVALFGIIKAGAVQVSVNPLYTARELKHQLTDAGVETILVFNGSTPTLAEVIEDTPVINVITVDLGDLGHATVAGPAADRRLADPTPFSKVLAEGAGMDHRPVQLRGDDLLFLQYTGGTTGLSKGAMLTHGNLVANTMQFRAFAGDTLKPGDEVVVTALPLYHIFALMVNLISYVDLGGTNHLVANPRDLEALIALMGRVKPTAFTGVNTLFAGLVAMPELKAIDMSRLTVCVGGGAAVHEVTSVKWKDATGQHIREGYGLSETSPILTMNPLTIDRFSGCVGLPVPSTDIRLLDSSGNDVPLGEEGEICAKGPQVTPGYWNRQDTNREIFTSDGYFRTGDIGLFTNDGYLRIVDRKKDMIIVSGFNVYPNEIEAVVAEVDGVAECACIGVPDEKSGEALRVFVVKGTDKQVTEDGIQAHCRANLAAYKVPRQFRFVDELPKSTVGKILRRDLRQVT
jgi:long-chain acyl-CoA synthetase